MKIFPRPGHEGIYSVEAELCWIEVSGRRHGPAVLPAGKNPDKPWIGGWVGRREGMGISREEKRLLPLTGFETWKA